MFNYGARYVSPMAWNGSNGIYAGQPGYVSFMAWRNTPLEDAMRDFAVSHAYVPLGPRLWTFGSAQHADIDGWTTAPGATAAPGKGYLDTETTGSDAVLVSPSALAILSGETDLLVVGIDPEALSAIAVDGLTSAKSWVALAPPQATAGLEVTPAGVSVPLAPPAAGSIEQIRITLTPRNAATRVRIRHLALLPPAPG